MSEQQSDELLERLRLQDELAAAELFDRYVDRLIALARSQLSPKLARRVDAEDVVQSACRSFFRLSRVGRFELPQGRDLWNLLAGITINKAREAGRRHTAHKRSIAAEESTPRDAMLKAFSPEVFAREPSPDEAALLFEETELMLRQLTSLHRQILELHLQGYTKGEIAEQAGCADRTVRRALERAREALDSRFRKTEQAG